MKKKLFILIVYLLGIVSVFLPYYKSMFIACGFGTSHQGFDYSNFLQMYLDNIVFFKPKLLNFIDFIWQTLVLISIVFSVIFFFYKKYIVVIFLNIISLIYFVLGLFSAFDILAFGFYILFFQQILFIMIFVKLRIDVQKNFI